MSQKCRYIEGNQSALKAFALRVFGQIHEVKAQKVESQKGIAQKVEPQDGNEEHPIYQEG